MSDNQITVTKRNGTQVLYSEGKILSAISKALFAAGEIASTDELTSIMDNIQVTNGDSVESIQEQVEQALMKAGFYKTASAYIKYRERHNESRFIRERLDYMEQYANSSDNASTASETDPNANVSQKNVANLEGEVYKANNRIIQRQRMKNKLNELFPEVAKQYEEDLNRHIIYTHDEASTPVLKYYCMAATLYPLMTAGVGNIDGVTPYAPNDIQSFSGQVTNLVFLLSSQCKGAVALGDYFIALNYYVVKEFGPNWYTHVDEVVTNGFHTEQHTMAHYIRKGMKQFIYGVNQPAGNRSYNSPFTNISYYDSQYFDSLFGEFAYPDGSKPEWAAIDKLQRMFMQLHRELRLIKPLTFPVSTMALVYDGNDYIDKEYKELCADEWAKGGSFFLYNSNNPTSLASCCRVLSEISDNTFSSTTGMTGVMTGSCNVITLNINRIVQDWYRKFSNDNVDAYLPDGKANDTQFKNSDLWRDSLVEYLKSVLERVYKYHIAYKTMLYDLEDRGMFAASNGGYIYMKKLYSTIGVLGYCEAAKFLGIEVGNNDNYVEFLRAILGTVKEQNKLNSVRNRKRPILFNSEAVPGENLAVKLYKWDKEDGYNVPEDQNLYNCYFYNPWDGTGILDKIKLHGKKISQFTDGGLVSLAS